MGRRKAKVSYRGGGRLRCPTREEEGYWSGGRLRCPTGEEEG